MTGEALVTAGAMDSAVIVVHYRTPDLTLACLHSALENAGEPIFLIAVDNGSGDGSIERVLEGLKGPAEPLEILRYRAPPAPGEVERWRRGREAGGAAVIVIESGRNGGYASGNNLGIAAALELGVEHLILLNSDAEPGAGYIERVRERFRREPGAGMVGARVLSPGGAVQSRGMILDPWKTTSRSAAAGEESAIDYLPGCFLALRRAAVKECGPLPEEYFLYYEDVDYARRMRRRGWSLAVEDRIEVIHREGGSSGGAVNAFRLYWCERGKVIFNWNHRRWALPWHLLYVAARFLISLAVPRRRPQALPLLRGALAGAGWCLGLRRRADR